MRRLSVALICILAWNAPAEASPNIVLIIADDQTYTDFGFMGNERVHTPNLDTLAARSVIFPNGYVPSSVCRPSLVSILTGLYPFQHGVYFNHGPPGNSGYNRMTSAVTYRETREKEFAITRELPTLPKRLSGYRSFQTGKFWEGHWKNGGFTGGMTTFTAPPPSQTYGGIRTLKSGEKVAHGNGDRGLAIGRETMQPIYDFIDESQSAGTPWLVWYAPYLPHQPHDSPEQFYELARAKADIEPHEVPYFASIAQFDHTVGELLSRVPADTIVAFVSDNGWAPSKRPAKSRPVEFEHTKNSKRAPFDDGLRTPILIAGPSVTPRIEDALVSSIDLMPTLLNLAGQPIPESLPGIDLLGELDPDRILFGEVYPGDASALGAMKRDIGYLWARQGDYKLILPQGEKPWGDYLGEDALFNVAKDPHETTNVIAQPQLASIVGHLSEALEDWWRP